MLLSSISRSLFPLFPSSGPSHGPWEGRGKTKRKEMWESGYEKERSLTFFHGGREESLFPPGPTSASNAPPLPPLYIPFLPAQAARRLHYRYGLARKEGDTPCHPHFSTATCLLPPCFSLWRKFQIQEPPTDTHESLSYNEGDYDLLHVCVVPLVWC